MFRVDLRELWQYRDLLWILAVRDVKVRYKQTIIGGAWAVIQPLVTMVIFAVLFGALMGSRPTVEGIPYSVSTFCGLLPWQLFAHALIMSSNSLVANERLITKIYFPRLLIPLASVLSGLVDFAIAFVILLLMMVWFGIVPGVAVLMLPVLLLLAIVTALGMGLWLAALNALYRDIRYVTPFLVQAGMLLTPVVYPAANILEGQPAWVQAVYMLNPMAGVTEAFRWALLDAPAPPLQWLALSALGVVLLFLGGVVYFNRMQRIFADWI